MYAFPRITLSAAAIDTARAQGMAPDAFYAMQLLEHTGICVVPGSGFGQRADTWHVRTTFLPAEEKVDKVAELMAKFHAPVYCKVRPRVNALSACWRFWPSLIALP